MSLVNEQPVNDHNGHELSNLVPFRPVPIRSSLDPATPDTTEQAPESSPPLAGPDTTEQPEQQPVTPPPAAAPAPAPPAPHQPDLPPNPTPPSYWGARGLSVVYWIAILTGAVGQMLAYGQLFGLGIPGYFAAAICATTLESTMVTATATALTKRVEGHHHRRWLPFLLAGSVAACGASVLNLVHWHSVSTSLAVLFSGIALLGYILHVMDGISEGTHYRERKAEYDTAVEHHRRRIQDREDAEHERYMADLETQQQAVQRAVETVAPEPEPEKPAKSTAPAKGSGSRKTSKSTASRTASTRATKAIALEVGTRHGVSTPSTLKGALTSEGYSLPTSPSTVENWCRELRQTGAGGQ